MSMDRSVRVAVPEHIVAKNVHEDVILLNVKDGTYYKLNATAGELLEKMKGGASFGEALDALLLKYNVDEAALRLDSEAILTELKDEGLLSFCTVEGKSGG